MMKKILVLLLAVASVCSAIQVCFPLEFRTDERAFEPERLDYFASRTWFSIANQKRRFDVDLIIVDDKPVPERLSFLFDYTKQMRYDITYFTGNKSAECVPHSITDNHLDPLCLANNAVHHGHIIYGGVLTAERYVEDVQMLNDTVRVEVLFIDNVNVPIRVVETSKTRGVTVREYHNFEEHVNEDAFLVPSFCSSDKKY